MRLLVGRDCTIYNSKLIRLQGSITPPRSDPVRREEI